MLCPNCNCALDALDRSVGVLIRKRWNADLERFRYRVCETRRTDWYCECCGKWFTAVELFGCFKPASHRRGVFRLARAAEVG